MSCNGTLFSLSDLQGVSVENESWISEHCVSNTLKATVFLVYLVVYIVWILAFSAALIRLWIKDHRITMPIEVFTWLLIGSLCGLIKMVVFLNGVNSRWKYLLFPIPMISVFWGVSDIFISWGRVLESTYNLGAIKDHFSTYQEKIFLLFRVWLVIGAVTLFGIGPIASFSKPLIFNWFFSVGFCHQTMVGGVTIVAIIGYGNRLLKKLDIWKQESQFIDSEKIREMEILVSRIKVIMKFAYMCIPPVLLDLVGTLIWTGVTQYYHQGGIMTYGMEYSFYLFFFNVEFLLIVGSPVIGYAVWTAPTRDSNSSKRDSVSEKSKAAEPNEKANVSFSYQIEELNAS